MPNRDYHDARREYEFAGLSSRELNASPFIQFTQWMDFAVAQNVTDPTAMSVSTVDATGQPHSRIVLLKEADHQGYVFYTHYDSAKGQQIEHNAKAALLFFWPALDRQVRIEGVLEKTTREDTQAYFASRPRDSQLAAFSSSQSQVINNRLELEAAYLNNQKALQNQEIPCPDHWGGYRLIPNHFEFWQGRPSRLHDRFTYQIANNQAWLLSRISP